MRERKPRLRLRELQSKTIRELRDLMRDLGVASQGCLEKVREGREERGRKKERRREKDGE